jgi:hypothetical protein
LSQSRGGILRIRLKTALKPSFFHPSVSNQAASDFAIAAFKQLYPNRPKLLKFLEKNFKLWFI